MDTFARMPVSGLGRIHMDPEPPVPILAHALLVRELSNEGDRRLLRAGRTTGGVAVIARRIRLSSAARWAGRPRTAVRSRTSTPTTSCSRPAYR